MLVFDNANPKGWIFRVERYFAFHQMMEAEKIKAAAISMDGEALAWFKWEVGRRPMRTWGEIKANMLDCFGLTQEGSVCEKFLAIRQEGTVREYRRLFEALASPLTCRSKSWRAHLSTG